MSKEIKEEKMKIRINKLEAQLSIIKFLSLCAYLNLKKNKIDTIDNSKQKQ